MKKETALKKIKQAVNKECKEEKQSVKDYIIELIYLTFESLESDIYARDENGKQYTSTKNLQCAIEINLEDEYSYVIEEARRLAL